MLTPEKILNIIIRFTGIVLILLSLNEIIRRNPWSPGYSGITNFLISGYMILVVIGVYLLTRGSSVTATALKNVNNGFDQFSLATLIVLTVKTIGITIMVLMGTALVDTLNFLLSLLEFNDFAQLGSTPVGLLGIKTLLYTACLLLIGYYLYVNGKLVYKILHIDLKEN